jgi:hypothetical protein
MTGRMECIVERFADRVVGFVGRFSRSPRVEMAMLGIIFLAAGYFLMIFLTRLL